MLDLEVTSKNYVCSNEGLYKTFKKSTNNSPYGNLYAAFNILLSFFISNNVLYVIKLKGGEVLLNKKILSDTIDVVL